MIQKQPHHHRLRLERNAEDLTSQTLHISAQINIYRSSGKAFGFLPFSLQA